MRDDHRSIPIEDAEEIEGNVLAEKTFEIVDRLRPHANAILLALGGALLALAAWVLVSAQSTATKSQSWDAFLAGLSGGDPQAFDEVVRRYPGTPAAEWSRLVMADMALIDGTELMFVNKDQAPPRLQAAADLYASILGPARVCGGGCGVSRGGARRVGPGARGHGRSRGHAAVV
jgi:hypothetical protein